MEIYELIDLNDCPVCGGAGILEEEGNSFYVMCMDCGARSVNVGYKAQEERLTAARKTAEVWNMGKAVSSAPGE
ncbi:MAG: Lar family restriction alleviation protein [Lachnospiraceae bacterium]